mmetsp:Transcript_25515/g.24821  ORF Transcript_25515/g.24821 Transcript_25515/m.24821 type:complete len:120 (+) Transcript_25515:533-892(+)
MRKRKDAIKEFTTLLEQNYSGTKYDKYFCEEFSKKLKKTEEVVELTEKIKKLPEGKVEPLVELVKQYEERFYQEREVSRKEDDKKRQEESKKINGWSEEDLNLLTKAIVKFAAGTPSRW